MLNLCLKKHEPVTDRVVATVYKVLYTVCPFFLIFFFFSPPMPRVFITLFVQYYSVICCPLNRTVDCGQDLNPGRAVYRGMGSDHYSIYRHMHLLCFCLVFVPLLHLLHQLQPRFLCADSAFSWDSEHTVLHMYICT